MKRRSMGASLKSKTLGLMVAFVLAFAGLCAMPLVANAAAGDTPAHGKTASPNGDGTYTLELSVTGDADTEVQTAANVNVLIIYDESQSMTTNVSGTNRSRADNAENVVHGFIAGLQTHQQEDDEATEDVDESANIQVAVVGFGPNASTLQGWTSDLSSGSAGANRFFDEGVDGQVTNSHNYGSNYGTNWEAALLEAQTLLRALDTAGDKDPTFVIFVTDGVCTKSGTGGGNGEAPTGNPWSHYSGYYEDAADNAYAIQQRTDTTMFGIYAYGNEADLLDDLIYYSNTGEHRTMTVGGTTMSVVDVPDDATAANTYNFGDTTDTTNYYNASDTAALTQAINDIFEIIVETLGITSASISDGTTNEVMVGSQKTELLEVDESSYQYWLSIPVVNNKFTRIDKVTGKTVEYTVTPDTEAGTCTVTWGDSNTITVNGTVSSGQFKFEWTEASELSNGVAPPEAKLEDGSVNWDLSSANTLLSGVTYSVTFECYPSQTTLDIIADMENDPYVDESNQGAWGKLPAEIQKYIDKTGKLQTNTTAKLTYYDTRLEDPGPKTAVYENPDPVASTAVEQLAVAKEWDNTLDDQQKVPIQLDVTRDGEVAYEMTLNSDNNYKGKVYISIGIMGSDGKPLSGAEGHDFTFAEPDGQYYHWQIAVPIVHPMLINNKATLLVKVDAKHPLPEGATKYEFNGGTYYVDEEMVSLTATNERRSSVNLVKSVSGANAPADAEFPFTLNIVNALDPGSAPSGDTGHNSDHWVWISIRDMSETDDPDQAPAVTDAVVSGATHNGEGWYYAASGTDVVIKMKAGYSVRFNNLPTGSSYTITEGDLPVGFSFDSAELTVLQGEGTGKPFTEGQTTTGTIDATNTLYQVAYANKYESGELDITKTVTGPEGFTPDSSKKFTFNVTLEKAGEGEEAESEAVTGKFKYTVGTSTTEQTLEITENGGTLQLAGGETAKIVGIPVGVTYTVTEDTASIPAGYKNTASSGTSGTISTTVSTASFTNTYSVTPAKVSFPVKKELYVPEELDGPEEWEYTITVTANGNAPKIDTMSGTINQSTTNGTITFGEFEFAAAGEYTYTVTEAGEVDGVENEKDAEGNPVEKTVTVTVTDNGNGTLSATADSTADSPLTFTNTYGTEPTEVEIDIVEKLVEYFPLAYLYDEEAGTGQFTFQVKDEEGNVVSKGVNGADGTVAFTPALKFTAPGDYTFTIVEVDDGQDGIDYDTTEFALAVTVTDNGDGTLDATPEYEDEPVFKNTYEATGETTITALKKLLSKLTDKQLELEGGEFTFTIEGSEGAPMPEKDEATNDANGQVDFGTVTFDVSEIPDEAWTYVKEPAATDKDDDEAKEVEAKDVDEEALEKAAPAMRSAAEAADEGADAEGDEVDDEAAADEEAEGEAADEGADAEGDEVDDEAADDEEAEGEADDEAEDDEVEAAADEAADEEAAPEPEADAEEVNAEVASTFRLIPLAMAAEPEVEALNETPDSVIVVDDKAAPADAAVEAAEADKALEVVEGKAAPTKAADDESGALRYVTFEYIIKEVAGDDPHIEYAGADTVAIVYVTVEDDGKGNLAVTKEYDEEEGNGGEFVNYYTPDPVIVDPPVCKIIEGNDDLYNGGDFTFVIAGPENGPMPENTTITNSPEFEKEGKQGYYEFGEIEFTAPGTYVYAVAESGSVENVTNDPESAKSFTFTVTEDSKGNLVVSPDTDDACWTFTNVYKEPPSNPAIDVEKTVTSTPKNGEYYESGETIEYEIVVTNTGDVDLHDVTVKDDLTGNEWTIASLAVSASKTYTTTYKVTDADATAGKVLNQATAEGYSPKDEKVTDDDDAEAKTGKKPEIPVTGDTLPIVGLIAVAVAAATTGVVAIRRRSTAGETKRTGSHARK